MIAELGSHTAAHGDAGPADPGNRLVAVADVEIGLADFDHIGRVVQLG